ncbi:hypothetical protein AMTRI_Chr05g58110 [Amborella trichopoda]
MDDERFWDNERLQIERIRELETEELEVEEVDEDLDRSSSDNSSRRGDDGGAGQSGGFTFDTCLTSLHTYLGEVDDTHFRLAFLEGGAILNLPMFYLEGIVLFPEATLPLRVIQPRFKAAVERALQQTDAPLTIGVIRVERHPYNGRLCVGSIGTTAEIRQFKRLEDGSLNVVTRGQQRFNLRRSWVDVEGAPCAEVQIVQEDTPLRTPRDAFGQLASISDFQNGGSGASCPKRNGYEPSPKRHVYEHSPKRRGYESGENDSGSASDTSTGSYHSTRDGIKNQLKFNSNKYGKIEEAHSSDDEPSPLRWWHRKAISCPVTSEGSQGDQFSGEVNESDSSEQEIMEDTVTRRQSFGDGGWMSLQKAHATDGLKQLSRGQRSFWPLWVYQMYDSYSLARKAADMWKQIIGNPSLDDLVRKPDFLSFYIASKIPVSDSTRQELLEIDGISYRLRREIQLLERFDLIHCKTCKSLIAKRSNMLVMSRDGPLNAFVNPYGYVHEIMTLNTTTGLALHGGRVTTHSWFPGYAWTIANCGVCESSMGWLFTATNKRLKPSSFWGVRSSQVADDLQ